MTMNTMYHPQIHTGRIYIAKMEGGQRLLSIADRAETEEQNLSQHLNKSVEKLFRGCLHEISFRAKWNIFISVSGVLKLFTCYNPKWNSLPVSFHCRHFD